MGTRDILTLSCGNYSNYLFSHFINNEEVQYIYENDISHNKEIDFSTIFNVSSNKSSCYHPRALICDYKDNFRLLPINIDYKSKYSQEADNCYYNEFQKAYYNLEQNNIISSNSNTQILTKLAQKTYPSLDNSINYWSDFLHTKLCSKSIIPTTNFRNEVLAQPDPKIYAFKVENREVRDFIKSCLYLRKSEFLDKIDEGLHHFMETSDYLQGFNFLLDSSSSHLSLQIHMLHYLKDEYPNKSIFVYMSFPDYLYYDQLDLDLKNGVKQTFYRELINSASLLNHLYNDNDSIECLFPLSLIENPFDLNKSNHKSWLPTALIDFSKAKSLYERSALISTAFASTTLPYRNFANAYYRMHHLSNFLSDQNSFRRNKMQKISCKYFFSDHDTQDNVFTLTPYSNYDVNKINESPINAFNVTRGFQSAVRKLEDIRQPTIKKEDAFEKIVNWENLNMVNSLQLSPAFPWIFNQPSLSKKSDDPFRSLNTYHSMESDPQLQINFFNQLLKQIECHDRSSSGAFAGLEEKDEKNEIIEFLNDYAA